MAEGFQCAVLEAILHQYPFCILGFHSDNGSEFLNERIATILNKLLIEFTKSRAYRTTDNALVEGKDGAVVRKHIGYGFIASEHADPTPAIFHGAMQSLSELPSSMRLCRTGEVRPGTYPETLSGRRLHDTLGEALQLAGLATVLKSGITEPMRHRSGQTHAEVQARHLAARSDLRLIRPFSDEAPVSALLVGKGGSNAAPFPLDPSPAQSPTSNSRRNSQASKQFPSGSSRIGIKLYFQAHFWIGKCSLSSANGRPGQSHGHPADSSRI